MVNSAGNPPNEFDWFLIIVKQLLESPRIEGGHKEHRAHWRISTEKRQHLEIMG